MRALLSNMLWCDPEATALLDGPEFMFTRRGSAMLGTTDEPVDSRYQSDGWTGFPRAMGIERAKCRGLQLEEGRVLPGIDPLPWMRPLREDQEKAVGAVLDHFRLPDSSGAVLVAPLGSGKTAMGLAVAQRLQTPVLVLVNTDILHGQWRDECRIVMGIDVGTIQETVEDLRPVTIGTIQTVHKRLSEKAANYFGIIIADETVMMGAEEWRHGVCRSKARYRLGLTATPRRVDGLWPMVEANFGRTIAGVQVDQLVPQVFMVPFPSVIDWKKFSKSPNFLTILNKILSGKRKRNEYIVTQIEGSISTGRRVLVLCDLRQHISNLAVLFNGRHPETPIDYYVADLPAKRTAPLSFGTWTFASKGLNVPELDTLILASPHSDVAQAMGRILRISPGKQRPNAIDLVDLGVPHLVNMARSRLRLYQSLGYEVMSYDDERQTWAQQTPTWLG